ncbi:MAG: CBS domain-containing protein [Hyphomicrobium sp.]
MSPNVVSVTPETPLRRIAQLLLEHGISAVPVVESGVPVGIISESDLIERQRPDGLAWRFWVAGLLGRRIHPFANGPSERLACEAYDVMSTPVITANEHEEAEVLMDLMAKHAIKRILIVRTDRLVGLVSRTDLMRWFARQPTIEGATGAERLAQLDAKLRALSPKSKSDHPQSQAVENTAVFTASAFREQVKHYQSARVAERTKERLKAAEQRAQEIDKILNRSLDEDSWRRVLLAAHGAAERGETEWQVMRMPREVCSDAGRMINISDPGWGTTLRGEAADLWLRWQSELRPRGFRMTARVLDYRDGIPGDIGLFLVWKE